METKIGFFEKFDVKSNRIEKSSTTLRSFIILGWAIILSLLQFFFSENAFQDWGFISFMTLLLVAAIYPKYLKDLNILNEFKTKLESDTSHSIKS